MCGPPRLVNRRRLPAEVFVYVVCSSTTVKVVPRWFCPCLLSVLSVFTLSRLSETLPLIAGGRSDGIVDAIMVIMAYTTGPSYYKSAGAGGSCTVLKFTTAQVFLLYYSYR